MTNLGSVQNSNSFARPKWTPTGVGTKPCTNRPNTHWIGRWEWQRKNSFQATTLHQCGKAWKPSPATRPHPPALRPINNWLKTWTSSTAGLKSKSLVWHPTPTLTVSQHSHQHPPPYCFSACTQDLWRWCKQSLQETEDKESTRPRRCLSSLPQSLCCPAIIHLHSDLQQITGAVWSPLLLQTLHHHPCTQETKNHRT